MKDAEFLELLNLYLDHEISAADAARLEAEVQRDPQRHRTYVEYCRMQKACTILAKDFAEQPAEKKVIAFAPRRSAWGGGLFAAGGLAVAAACFAFVLVNRAPESKQASAASANPSLAASNPTPAPLENLATAIPAAVNEKLPGSAIAHTVTIPARRVDVKPVFVAASSGEIIVSSNARVVRTASDPNAQAQFEWMKAVQLAPMQSLPQQDVRLDPRSPLQPASRTYTSGRSVQGSVEMAAFRFQK